MKKFIKDNDELIATLSLVWIILISVILNIKRMNVIELILIATIAFLASMCTIFIIKIIIKIIATLYKKIEKVISTNAVLLVTMFLALITFALWFFPSGEKDFGELWLNLSAGFMSSVFTIVVIDKILKKQKEKEDKPIQLALYRDVQLFTTRVVSLWEEMYVQCNSDRKEISIDELFSEETMDFIFEHLDLRGYPAVTPKQDWFTYIDREVKVYIEHGNKILDRYILFAEPELLQDLHYLINDSAFIYILTYMKNIRVFDVASKIPRPPIPLYYTVKPTERDYESVKCIIQWCHNNYKKLKEDENVFKVSEKVIIINKHIEPTSVMKSDELDIFISAYEQFGNQKEKEN